MSLITNIKKEFHELDRSGKMLRKFGLLIGFILFAIAFFLDSTLLTTIFSAIGILFILLGIFSSQMLLFPYLAWMGFAVVAGYFVSRIILFLLFYFMLTPIGLLVRIFKGDLLKQKIDKKAKSYWINNTEKYDPKSSESM